MIPVQRTNIRLKADPRKVIAKPLDFGDPARIEPVERFVKALSEQDVEEQLQKVLEEFAPRHFDLEDVFREHFQSMFSHRIKNLSKRQELLLAAYFTHEYSIEAAALFNPSIVPHPDQRGMDPGELRFVLSLRAVGEGHISSIAFQTGRIASDGTISLGDQGERLSIGNVVYPPVSSSDENSYDLHFPDHIPLNSRILFPRSPAEANGMEDARFVQFAEEEEKCYYGTYTAYNGHVIHPHLIETRDLQNFKIRPFTGEAAANKGMALFPEKINGRYAMIGRQGGRELSVMYSDELLRWDAWQLLQSPQRSWEILQMGNCGSPVKTDKGWLLLTHAVGPMRRYVLSFTLLDLEYPDRVLASLEQPLMSPNAEEREGYVPNVLYTCGLLEHRGKLIIPYAMSDSSISFAVVETARVLKELG